MKTKFLLLLTFLTFLTSCESNENAIINITEDDIVGAWNVTELKIDDASVSITKNGQTYNATANAIGKNYNATTTFTKNPNNLKIEGSLTMVATATINGQTETQEYPINNLYGFESGSWTLNNNTITLNKNGESVNFEVVDFSTNELKLIIKIDKTITDNSSTGIISGSAFVTLSK